ncbi:MAG: sulfotransferase [Thiohalomonadales bacterium]
MIKLPHFIIIGAMKSATSTLQDQLIQQPGIFMCDPKEPNFFSDDEQYSKGMKWYKDLFYKSPENFLLGEASTHYTKLPTYPETVNRINKDLSDTRFIYVMRHPIDRLISHYIHEWSMGNYKCDINVAIKQYPELVNYSRYAMQLEPYFDNFGRNKVLPVFFDRLINHSQSELERVCNFITYKSRPIWHEDLTAKNVSNKRIRRFPLYRLLIESKIATSLRRKIIPKQLRNIVKDKLRMQNRPVINEYNLNELNSIFNQDLEILGKMLDLKINCENFKEVTSLELSGWTKNEN